MKIQGIYKIRNCINGKVYIGQSINIKSRFQSHKDVLKTKYNHPLYNSIRKYGIQHFEFSVLEEINDVLLLDSREQYWLDHYKSYDSNYGYNLRPRVESNRGCKYTEASKAKRRILVNDPVYKKKLSDSVKATISTPEFKEYFKYIMKAVTNTPEHKKKCSERQKRLCENPEYIKNLSENSKNLWKDASFRNNYSNKMRIRNKKPEVKKQKREKAKELWQNPVYREKLVNAHKTPEYIEKMRLVRESQGYKDKLKALYAKRREAKYKKLNDLGFIDKVKELYLTQNMERKTVAKMLNMSDSFFGNLLKEFGLQKPKSLSRKIKNNIISFKDVKAKYTNDIVHSTAVVGV